VINATDPELLSGAKIEGRVQAIEYIRFQRDKVPGYWNYWSEAGFNKIAHADQGETEIALAVGTRAHMDLVQDFKVKSPGIASAPARRSAPAPEASTANLQNPRSPKA